MDNGNQEWPIPLPAILIEIADIKWKDLTANEIGDVTIRIYFYQDIIGDCYNGSENEDHDLELLDKQDEVMDSLSGFTANGLFSGLIRTADSVERNGKRYICLRSEFTSAVLQQKHEDDSCSICQLNVERNEE